MNVTKEFREYLETFKKFATSGEYFIHRDYFGSGDVIYYFIKDGYISSIKEKYKPKKYLNTLSLDYIKNVVDVGYGKYSVLFFKSLNNIDWEKEVGNTIDEVICKIADNRLFELHGIDIDDSNFRKIDPSGICFSHNGKLYAFESGVCVELHEKPDGFIDMLEDINLATGSKPRIRKIINRQNIIGLSWYEFCDAVQGVAYLEDTVSNYTSNYKVSVERFTDNLKKRTFDMVKVTINLAPHGKFNTYKKVCDRFKNEIKDASIKAISKNREFIRKKVPVNFLRLTSGKIMHDGVLELIFELKELKN